MRRPFWLFAAVVVVVLGLLETCDGYISGGRGSADLSIFGVVARDDVVGSDEAWALGTNAPYADSVTLSRADGTYESWDLDEVAPGAHPESFFQSAFVDDDGRPWFITFQSGAIRNHSSVRVSTFDGQRWRSYTPDEVGCPQIAAITPGPGRSVWAYGYGCVAYLDQSTSWKRVATDGLIPEDIHWIDFGPDGTLWVVGWWSGGWVASWDGEEWVRHHDVPRGFPQDLVFDLDGGVWVAFASQDDYDLPGGLAHFDGVAWDTHPAGVDGLQPRDLGRLYVDTAGGLWIAYHGDCQSGAVSLLSDGQWTHWTERDGIPAGHPTHRHCSAISACRVDNPPQGNAILELSDHSMVVRMLPYCWHSGKSDSECCGGGWVKWDGSTWTPTDPPNIGFQSTDGGIWSADGGSIDLIDPND